MDVIVEDSQQYILRYCQGSTSIFRLEKVGEMGGVRGSQCNFRSTGESSRKDWPCQKNSQICQCSLSGLTGHLPLPGGSLNFGSSSAHPRRLKLPQAHPEYWKCWIEIEPPPMIQINSHVRRLLKIPDRNSINFSSSLSSPAHAAVGPQTNVRYLQFDKRKK